MGQLSTILLMFITIGMSVGIKQRKVFSVVNAAMIVLFPVGSVVFGIARLADSPLMSSIFFLSAVALFVGAVAVRRKHLARLAA